MLHAHMLQQFDAGDACRTRAVGYYFQVFQCAAGNVGGIDDTCGGDDRGAVLVVVEHGDVAQFFQLLFNNEAIRRADIL